MASHDYPHNLFFKSRRNRTVTPHVSRIDLSSIGTTSKTVFVSMQLLPPWLGSIWFDSYSRILVSDLYSKRYKLGENRSCLSLGCFCLGRTWGSFCISEPAPHAADIQPLNQFLWIDQTDTNAQRRVLKRFKLDIGKNRKKLQFSCKLHVLSWEYPVWLLRSRGWYRILNEIEKQAEKSPENVSGPKTIKFTVVRMMVVFTLNGHYSTHSPRWTLSKSHWGHTPLDKYAIERIGFERGVAVGTLK